MEVLKNMAEYLINSQEAEYRVNTFTAPGYPKGKPRILARLRRQKFGQCSSDRKNGVRKEEAVLFVRSSPQHQNGDPNLQERWSQPQYGTEPHWMLARLLQQTGSSQTDKLRRTYLTEQTRGGLQDGRGPSAITDDDPHATNNPRTTNRRTRVFFTSLSFSRK